MLFSEETMNFYQYNLRIKPKQLKLAISYLMKLMNILLNYNQAQYNDLAKLIYRTASKTYKMEKEDLEDLSCREIIKKLELQLFEVGGHDNHHHHDHGHGHGDEGHGHGEEKKHKHERKKTESDEDDVEDRDLQNRINSKMTLPLNEESHGDHFHQKNNEGPEHLERCKHIWNAKIARYLAYIIDGGILCSQFTLRTFLTLLEQVNDPTGEDN